MKKIQAKAAREQRIEHLRSEIRRCDEAIEGGTADNWWHIDRDRLQAELDALVTSSTPVRPEPVEGPAAPARTLTAWVRDAMRFIDLCDADAAGYDDLHADAERLTIQGYALFGIDPMADDASLVILKHHNLIALDGDSA